jgi:hypothetical protein
VTNTGLALVPFFYGCGFCFVPVGADKIWPLGYRFAAIRIAPFSEEIA